MSFPHFEVANSATEIDIVRTLAAAGNGIHLTVTDSSGIASGRGRGIYIEYTMDTAQTGTAGVRTIALDTTISANVPSWTGIDIYLAALGGDNNYTVGNVIPLSIYLDDLGDNVNQLMALDIGINSSAAIGDRHTFIRCREHTTVWENSTILRLEGLNAAGYLLYFERNPGTEDSAIILDSATCDQTADMRIRVRIAESSADRYIYLYPV